MTKKHFIALADHIRRANTQRFKFTSEQIHYLAIFCQEQNPQFNCERWLGYIAGTNGPNGGKVRPEFRCNDCRTKFNDPVNNGQRCPEEDCLSYDVSEL